MVKIPNPTKNNIDLIEKEIAAMNELVAEALREYLKPDGDFNKSYYNFREATRAAWIIVRELNVMTQAARGWAEIHHGSKPPKKRKSKVKKTHKVDSNGIASS